MPILKQNQMVLYFQDEPGGPMTPLGIGKYGGEAGTVPQGSKSVVYGVDRFGNPIPIMQTIDPPSGLPSKTIVFYEEDTIDRLQQAAVRGNPITLQDRYHEVLPLDNPFGWTVLFHWGRGRLGDKSLGAGATPEFSGSAVTSSLPVVFNYVVKVVRPKLSALPSTGNYLTFNALSVVFINDPIRIPGYPGPDRIGYVGLASGPGAPPTLLYTATGGSAWDYVSVDPLPADTTIDHLVYQWVNSRNYRLVASTKSAISGSAGTFAIADVDPSTPDATSWQTVVNQRGTAGGTVSAVSWPWIEEFLVGSENSIYVLQDTTSFDVDPIYTGTKSIDVIVKASQSPEISDEYVYFLGEADLFLKKFRGSSTVSVLPGVGNTNNFTAAAIANDGTLYAGNGTALYRTRDEGRSWSLLKDFGTGATITGIGLIKDDPELIRVVVKNTTPPGHVWLSVDGGATWELIPPLYPGNYLSAYFSPTDPNFSVLTSSPSTDVVLHSLSA